MPHKSLFYRPGSFRKLSFFPILPLMGKKKNPLADSLIDSILEDIQDIDKKENEESSVQSKGEAPSGLFMGSDDFSVEKTFPLIKNKKSQAPKNEDNDKTVAIPQPKNPTMTENPMVDEKTIAVTSIQAKRKLNEERNDKSENTVSQIMRTTLMSPSNATETSFIQAENLKLAQKKILELENEVDKLRAENDELANAGQILKNKIDELTARLSRMDLDHRDQDRVLHEELNILKSSLQYKDRELENEKTKNEQLNARLKTDFKKIRVRERELENRLELAKLEKTAIVKSKDETILDLKRKIDHIEGELETYREKCTDLNKKVESNQEQFKRTVKALRLALSNLEVSEEIDALLKKAQ